LDSKRTSLVFPVVSAITVCLITQSNATGKAKKIEEFTYSAYCFTGQVVGVLLQGCNR